jgi:hypothetical protein
MPKLLVVALLASAWPSSSVGPSPLFHFFNLCGSRARQPRHAPTNRGEGRQVAVANLSLAARHRANSGEMLKEAVPLGPGDR